MKAFITGISGMDGSHLADLLLENGYEVHGLVRRPVTDDFENLRHCRDRLTLHYGDMLDGNRLASLIREIKPDEVYNLAGVTFVPSSWDHPVQTGQATGLAVCRLLQAVLLEHPRAKFYQASSSEMFGNAKPLQNENTPMIPVSPYGAAKLYGHRLVATYRERYGMFAVSGICFNHESPRRGRQFVTRKVAAAVARIKLGKQKKLTLGNLNAKRDWGYAPDFVRGMWLMLQADQPRDYVIATGTSKYIRELLTAAFRAAELGDDWGEYVEVDNALIRSNEIHELRGDASRIRKDLGWEHKIQFEEIVQHMVQAEIAACLQAG